jgi:hypothetical protein
MASRFGFGRGTTLEQQVETTPELSHGDGDHERFAHYVHKGKIVESALTAEKSGSRRATPRSFQSAQPAKRFTTVCVPGQMTASPATASNF